MFIPYFPKYPLNQYVKMIWYHNATVSYEKERILPTGTVELIINLGSPTQVFLDNGIQVNKEFWVCGMHTGSILHQPIAETHMIGVSFKPFGALPFLKVPMSELKNSLVNLELIWGNEPFELKQQLLAQKSVRDHFLTVETFLTAKLSNRQNHFAAIIAWLDLQLSSSREVHLEDLYQKIGYSKRHIIQEFRKFVGLTPKDLKQIYRFNDALKAIDPNQINWTSLALTCDYYDQAHFNNQFKNFSGLTPSEYVQFRNQFLNTPSQGEDVHFVPVS
ncbi:AraC family transcriptional regulator [Agaribacillus aureus]